jgi:hypothetical protein
MVAFATVGRLVAEAPEDVSIIQLIATPGRYDGKLVRTIGFLRLEFEGDYLYLHQEDFKHAIMSNRVWVDIPENFKNRGKLSMNYVIIEGVFGAKHSEIGRIRRADIWSNPAKPHSEDVRQNPSLIASFLDYDPDQIRTGA